MLSLFGRKQRSAPQFAADRPRRNKQINLRAAGDCIAAFEELANRPGLSKAALFEDMVAERWNDPNSRD